MWRTALAAHMLKKAHGDLVFAVANSLMHRGTSTVAELEHQTKIKGEKIKTALVVLVHHGMVDFMQNKQNQIEYTIHTDRVINLIFYHKEAKCAGLLYGDAAEMIVEELLQEGRLPMDQLVDTVTSKLNEAIVAQGADLRQVQPSFIQDKFERLVATHFIRRCSLPVKNARGQVVGLELPADHLRFTVPPKKAAGSAVKVKQEPTEDEEPAAKRPRFSQDVSQPGSSDSTETIYWEVNHPRFQHHFRDQMLVSAVANTLSSEKAAEIMRTILRHCEKTTDPLARTTAPVSFNEIHHQMPKDKMMTKNTLEQWLKLMTDIMPEFISKVGDSGGGMYIVNTFQAMESLCSAHITSVVEERRGSKARRIVRVILKNRHIEEGMIERFVLMPGKEVRQLLSRLIQEDYLDYILLSKNPEQVAPTSYFLLFTVNVPRVARRLLENSYHALLNLLQSQECMVSDAKRLLEKRDRVEAIMVSLGLPASYALEEAAEGGEGGLAVDAEKKEQVDAIMEAVTPAERRQLKKIKALTHHFEQAEHSLIGSTIFTLASYLVLTYQPPRPKPVRKFVDL